MSNIVQCTKCGKYIYLVNKPICCGINYAPPVEEVTEPIAEVENLRLKKIVTKKIRAKKKKTHYNMDKELKASVLERDNYKCTKCGSKQDLHVHHIEYRENGGSEEQGNLTTLCDICHAEVHRDEPVYNIMITKLFKIQTV